MQKQVCAAGAQEDNLQDMFQRAASGDPNVRYRRDVTDQCGCYPNQIWRVDDNAVLAVPQSKRGEDWALSQNGLQRIQTSKQSGKLQNAHVVLAKQLANPGELLVFVAALC